MDETSVTIVVGLAALIALWIALHAPRSEG